MKIPTLTLNKMQSFSLNPPWYFLEDSLMQNVSYTKVSSNKIRMKVLRLNKMISVKDYPLKSSVFVYFSSALKN